MSQTHEAPASERLSPVILGDAPSHAERARTLVERGRRATLCTLMAAESPGVAGYPYGSVVNYALDARGWPIILVSALAEHTRNFKADPRASIFVQEGSDGGPSDVLALGRVTLLGRIEDAPQDEVKDPYLGRHPDARYYVGYRDFAFYRLRLEGIRYIGGFGRMSWADVPAYEVAEADPVADFARDVLAHMNTDHEEALIEPCRGPAGVEDVQLAELTGVDCYGFEMSARTPKGPRFVRLGFGRRVTTPDDVRGAFIALLAESRKQEKRWKSLTEHLWMEIPQRRGYANITSKVEELVARSGVQEGLCLVNAMHITASVYINDNESGLLKDFEDFLERLAPFNASSDVYRHNRTGEDNGDAHIKRQLFGREVVVAITNGKLDFGPWEQIFYAEFDGKRRKRVLVKVIGE